MTEQIKKRWTWLRRGDWSPLIPYPFRGVIMLAWVLLPIPYGFDYLQEDPARQNRLTAVEKAMALSTWGWIMIVAGLLASASLLMRWRMRSVVSLHVLGALWLTLGIGLLMDSFSQWGGDGYRGAVMFFAVSTTYWAAAIGYYYQQEEDEGEESPLLLEKEDEGDESLLLLEKEE